MTAVEPDADMAAVLSERAAYAAHVGEVWRHGEPDEFWTQFEAQPAFTDQADRRYDWSRTMSAADVVANLGTYSQFLILDPVVRDAFFADLTGRLDDDIASNCARMRSSRVAWREPWRAEPVQ
jgi:hypothetical protein